MSVSRIGPRFDGDSKMKEHPGYFWPCFWLLIIGLILSSSIGELTVEVKKVHQAIDANANHVAKRN